MNTSLVIVNKRIAQTYSVIYLNIPYPALSMLCGMLILVLPFTNIINLLPSRIKKKKQSSPNQPISPVNHQPLAGSSSQYWRLKIKDFFQTIISNIHQINKIWRNEINWIFLSEVKTGLARRWDKPTLFLMKWKT